MKRNFKRMAQYALGAEITLSLWNRVRLWVEACDCTNSGVYRQNKFTLFAKCALIKCFIFCSKLGYWILFEQSFMVGLSLVYYDKFGQYQQSIFEILKRVLLVYILLQLVFAFG